MEAVRPKKKRSELELLLGAGDGVGPSAFPPRLPALSISSPTLVDVPAESDEQLARRLHEELNGMRSSRRGSRALGEDHNPLSPGARGVASPHTRPKPDTPKVQSAAARSGSAALASVTEGPCAGRTSAPATGGASAAESGAARTGSEAAKRKRNVVPARELHLLLQQASSTSARVDGPLSPVRSARSGSAGRGDPAASQQASRDPAATGADTAAAQPARRESDVDRAHAAAPDKPSPSSGCAPVPPLRSSPALQPSQLPPKLRQRYLAGPPGATAGQPPPASASASVLDKTTLQADAALKERSAAGSSARRSSDGATATVGVAAAGGAKTAVTPSGVLDGGRNSLLSGQSGQSTDGSCGCETEASVRAGAGAGPGPTGEPSQAGSNAGGIGDIAAGASVGGCSSTDETENETDNGCAAVLAGAATGGPTATSLKGVPPPPTFSASQTAEKARHEEHEEPALQHGHGAEQQGPQEQGHHASSLRVPKLPMVRAGRGWFRGRLVREAPDGQRVLVEVPGAPGCSQPVWLPADSDRIWRGSYKGKDWKYLGDGAWEPKPGAFKRGKQGSSSNGLPLPLPAWAAGAASEAQLHPADIPVVRPKRERERERSGAGAEPTQEQRDSRRVGSEGPGARPQRPQRRSSATGSGPSAEQPAAGPAAPKIESTAETAVAVVAPAQADAGEAAKTGSGADAPEAAPDAEFHANLTETRTAATAPLEAVASVPVKMEETAEQVGSELPGQVADPMDVAAGPDTAAENAAGSAAVEEVVAEVPSTSGAGNGGSAAAARISDGGNAVVDAPAVTEYAGMGDGDDGAVWEPGASFPRKHAPRRARRRQQRLQTPLDGLQMHRHSYNEHHAVMASGDESGGDAAGSDAEQGANHGRRRAAARAAAVAAAAARAEAEEDELEDVAGRRPPQRDKHQPCPGGVDVPVGGKRHSSQPQQRPRARPDGPLGGDSSGVPDESLNGEAGADVRQRNGSRGNSQPGSEVGGCGNGTSGSAGCSPAWEGPPGARSGPSAGACHSMRSRRKGKPCRSRIVGEGDGWDLDLDLQSTATVWARMPECIRRLYYTPAPVPARSATGQVQAAAGTDAQLVATGRNGSFQQRRSAGFYPGSQAQPTKRRKVYEEDPGFVTPPEDDEPDPEEADDPDRDEDYRPPTNTLGRRYSGAHGGRRCSGGGGGAGRRGVGAYEPPGWYGVGALTAAATAAPCHGGMPSALAGLLEAALGHSCEDGGTRAAVRGTHETGGDAKPCIALFGSAPTHAATAPPHSAHPSHVALSDSSANNSAGEEGKGPLAMGAAVPLAQLPCGATSPLPLCGGSPLPPGGGSPLPPGGVLRPGTPTRARRTGKPPSAVLGAGAPLPKLPALSSSASLRLQLASGPGDGSAPVAMDASVRAAVAAAAAATGGTGASGDAAPLALQSSVAGGAPCDGAEAAPHPFALLGAGGQGPCADQPYRICGTGDPLPLDSRGPFGASSVTGMGLVAIGSGSLLLNGPAAGTGADGDAGRSVFTTGAAAAAAATASVPQFPSAPCGGAVAAVICGGGATGGSSGSGRCCVMEAIDTLLLEQQPAMQQLAMRAQFELDSVGLSVQAQHAAMAAAAGAARCGDAHGPGQVQRQASAGRRGGRGVSGALAQRSGSLPESLTQQLLPTPPPEALMAALPSVELVVDLFSSRTPCGRTQEALAEFVSGASALPLFQHR